jgi:hypothetical protein
MVVVAVDQRDVHAGPLQFAGGSNPAEATSQHENVRAAGLWFTVRWHRGLLAVGHLAEPTEAFLFRLHP